MNDRDLDSDVKDFLNEVKPEEITSVSADLHYTSIKTGMGWHALNYPHIGSEPYKEDYSVTLKSKQGRSLHQFTDQPGDQVASLLSKIVLAANLYGGNLQRISQTSDIVYINPAAIVDFYHEPEKGGFSHGKYTTVLRDIHEHETHNWAGTRFAINTTESDRNLALQQLLGDMDKDWLSLKRDSGVDNLYIQNSIGGRCDAYFRISSIKDIKFTADYAPSDYEEPRFWVQIIAEDPQSKKQKISHFGFGDNDVAAKTVWANLREKVIRRNLELSKVSEEYPFSAVARDIVSGLLSPTSNAEPVMISAPPSPQRNIVRTRPKRNVPPAPLAKT